MSIPEIPKKIRQIKKPGVGSREWLTHHGEIPLLISRGIEAVGWSEEGEGFRLVQPRPSVLLLYACLAGRGEVLEGNDWRPLVPGTAYLAPLGWPNGYRAVPAEPLHTCWVLSRNDSLIATDRPRVVPAPTVRVLRCAIQGLYYEYAGGSGEPDALEMWADVIVACARRIGRPDTHSPPSRLRPLWDRVLADVATPWTLPALAREAALSEETLRQICRAETGRAPMEYVTYLRLRAAAALLATHHCTVAEAARRVGYANPFGFSAAFKRVLGVSPSEYRGGHGRVSGK